MIGGTSIRRQMQWLGGLPALIMLVSLLLALTWQRFQDAESDLQTRGNFVARYIASSSEFGVASGNTEELRLHARFAMQSPDVLRVRFYDADQMLLLDVVQEGGDNGGERVFEAGIYRQPLMFAADMAGGFVQPSSSRQRIGKVEVVLSDASIGTRQQEILVASIFPAVFALVVGFIIAGRMASRLSHPIQRLSSLVQRSRGGEYQARGHLPLRGEL